MSARAISLAYGLMFVARVAAAQQETAKPPDPSSEPTTFKLFTDTPPRRETLWQTSGRSESIWKLPEDSHVVPQWKIGYTAKLKGPAGLTFSAGFSGRRGDPLPAYLSDGMPMIGSLGQSLLTMGPGATRTQWDAKFGVEVPILDTRRLKLSAFGEWYQPLQSTPATPAPDSSATFLKSSAFIFGVRARY